MANCFLRSRHSRLRSPKQLVGFCSANTRDLSAATQLLHLEKKKYRVSIKEVSKLKGLLVNDILLTITSEINLNKFRIDNLPLKATISAPTISPPQLTVTCTRSFNRMSFSTIIRVGAMPVLFSSGKKNNTFEGCFPVCLHNRLRDMTDSNSDFAALK